VTGQPTLTTPRLRLRPWRDADLAPFAALNADPKVMAHFPKPLDRRESDEAAARIRAGFAQRGYGWWAVEVPGEVAFAGFIGLSIPGFDAHFMPCVEIGWRLAWAQWGKGYATEGARAALGFAFGTLGLREVVAFTTTTNLPSQAVMRRLGMHRSPADDFDHPNLPEGHRLRRHVLFRIAAASGG